MPNYQVNMNDNHSAFLTVSNTKSNGTKIITLLTPADEIVAVGDTLTHPLYTDKNMRAVKFVIEEIVEFRPSVGVWLNNNVPTWWKLIVK